MFVTLFNVWLHRRQLDFICVFSLNLLWHVALVGIILEENSLTMKCTKQRGAQFHSPFRCLWIFQIKVDILDTISKRDKGSFSSLVALWNLGHINERSYFFVLKCISMSCTLNGYFTPISITSCVGHLKITGLLSYTDLPNVNLHHYTISKSHIY